MPRRAPTRLTLCAMFCAATLLATLAACASPDAATSPTTTSTTNGVPCSVSGVLSLTVAQTARVDCSNGGTTVSLAGNGASYLVVAQFAASLVPDVFVPYQLRAGQGASASVALPSSGVSALRARSSGAASWLAALPKTTPGAAQRAFSAALRARARQKLTSGAWQSAPRAAAASMAARATKASFATVPSLGTMRQFRVLANSSGTSFATVGATLAYAGSSVLVYIDTLGAGNGFTAAQIQSFGALFDGTLYPLDTAAFGPTSDVDGNGHVIMLMSPAVNRLTSTVQCQTQGFVAGFFDEEDLSGGASDPNSNNGEVFYSIVPDPSGVFSCSHTVADLGQSVPATFLHELQHLISYSQHVVIHGGSPEYGWLDEGMSIVAEELGSAYYEQKCPGTACRTSPTQIFPDSAQGFVSDFLYDSYEYALLPDTASVTLHSDSDDGFSWRGGDWLLIRWLGDQLGSGVFKKMDQSTLTGVANIEAASGQAFPALFANFGLSLYTDSLPGLPRTTAPAVDRFVSRNVRQLWARLFATSGGASDIPLASPVQLYPITADTSTSVMYPGTMSFFRLDTSTGAASVTVQFSGPGGAALPSTAKPQLAIFRLPPGQ
ncbi:MAG: hypothetical protein ABI442_12760 [Gemmatimonadaceae bacterium]